MKFVLGFFGKVFNCQVSRIFFVADLIVCAAAFDWQKSFAYFVKINESGCAPKPAVSFGLYDSYGGSMELNEMLLALTFYLILIALFVVFLAPSLIISVIILGALKMISPALCDETVDLIAVPVFMIVNAIYWLLLGYLIESSYLKFIENKPLRKNLPSMFPD